MKRLSRIALINTAIVVSLLTFVPLSQGQATDYTKIQAPPLHAFKPQVPKRIQLANGMVIFLQEDHELPFIRGTARIRGGSIDEPADKAGLTWISSQVWRNGGTKDKTGDELDDYLAMRAASIEIVGRNDSNFAGWDCLKQNFDEVFAVYADLLRNPEFREDKIPISKNHVTTSIARRNDTPFEISSREAMKLVYGATNPYAIVPEYATVARIARQDLVNWHEHYVHPNNIILGVVGDFDSKDMEAKLRKAFDSWPKEPAVPKTKISFPGPKPGMYFAAKDDVTTSVVQMLDNGTTFDSPDYYALEVFNQFFGQGFSSRLFSNIRSVKGLAYAVGGGVQADFDHPGMLNLFLATKSNSTAAAIDAFNAELDGLKTHPVTPDELAMAKKALLNSFVFRFASKQAVLNERMTYEFYGYPQDFLEKYRAGIEKVTAADVTRVAEKYVKKDRMAILVVGKASDFDRPLASFGPVTTLDITIPPPGAVAK